MAGITATYVSSSGFTVVTDRTDEFIADRRVKANCGVDGYKFGTITSSVSGAGDLTTVILTVASDDLTSNLTDVYYGIVSEGASGSVPVHNHNGNEGSGGVVDGAVHDIASHSDTTATGTELETLTDNSIADALHRHSELVGATGTPDPALSITSAGNVGIGTSDPVAKLHVEKDTGDVYDSTTVTALFGDSDSYDNVFITGLSINTGYGYDVDNSSLWLNYRGYQGEDTRYRNLSIGDGKGNKIGFFDADTRTFHLSSGTGINEFSIDDTLAGDSDDAVPTEQAVKAYVDARGNTSLVDNSIANTLHRHSELVASDGDPDPAFSINSAGDATLHGTKLVMTNPTPSGSCRIELGQDGSGPRYAYIDLIGDDTYTDYGLRVIRGNGGENTTSQITHKGTGDFYIETAEAGLIAFKTDSTTRLTVAADGTIEINGVTNIQDSEISSSNLQLNKNGSGNRSAFIDLVGDDTYTDYGLRIQRTNTGENANSVLYHRGTGTLYLITRDANSTIAFQTADKTRMTIDGEGSVSLSGGTGINEFSTDDTLAGDSDDAVPTEQAVKAYVDGVIHTQGTDTTLGTMTADIDMDSSYQVVNLQAPTAAGEALRQTVNITEADLEQLTDGSATLLHVHADITGNAATATALETGRTINDVSFDGTGNIVVEPYISDDDTGDTNCPIVFTAHTSAGYKRLYEDSAIYIDNTNNYIYATQFHGDATGTYYSDLAEKHTCQNENLIVGTVISACTESDYEVQECLVEKCSSVIGIVSEKAGHIMNVGLKNSITVGLTGKVLVRIIGPIKKGQPIISAGNGCARQTENEIELLYKIGTSLEGNNNQKEKLIYCSIK